MSAPGRIAIVGHARFPQAPRVGAGPDARDVHSRPHQTPLRVGRGKPAKSDPALVHVDRSQHCRGSDSGEFTAIRAVPADGYRIGCGNRESSRLRRASAPASCCMCPGTHLGDSHAAEANRRSQKACDWHRLHRLTRVDPKLLTQTQNPEPISFGFRVRVSGYGCVTACTAPADSSSRHRLSASPRRCPPPGRCPPPVATPAACAGNRYTAVHRSAGGTPNGRRS